MLRILGVGLSRTGTTSLTTALSRLGYRAEHYCWHTFRKIIFDGHRDFRLFDSIEALTDIPGAYYYQQIAKAYPALKYIQTIRDVDSWWHSMCAHCDRLEEERDKNAEHWRFVRALHGQVYGSPTPHEGLYKRRYLEFNQQLRETIPADQLLIMDITAADGWGVLCPFVGKPVPPSPFPHENKRL
jgi:hypothetical protein